MADTNFMFDELDNKNAAANSGVRPVSPGLTKTVDIFSEVDKTVKPEPFKPRDNNPTPIPGTVIPPENGWLKNKLMVFALIFGGLIIVVGGGYLGLKLIIKNTAPVSTDINKEEVNNNQTAPEVKTPANGEANIPANQTIEPVITQPIDSDQDGLTDEEEAALGTSPSNPDTDQDGLTDREEAKVYLTDPLIADTDGDGYSDGQEIKNGFNPNGSGKLLDINK